jgi:hypothetical protein
MCAFLLHKQNKTNWQRYINGEETIELKNQCAFRSISRQLNVLWN